MKKYRFPSAIDIVVYIAAAVMSVICALVCLTAALIPVFTTIVCPMPVRIIYGFMGVILLPFSVWLIFTIAGMLRK